MTMSLPGYSRVRIAWISSGLGTGVAVGMSVGVDVWVGVSVGTGDAVDVGRAAGVVKEAVCPGPQAERRKEIKITMELQVNTLFIF